VLREPVGRIHWAGAEYAVEWNGYMEGTVRSGRATADEILEGGSVAAEPRTAVGIILPPTAGGSSGP
jgi:monoamine oxidase